MTWLGLRILALFNRVMATPVEPAPRLNITASKFRQWGKAEVAPDDATGEELALHMALWGDVFVRAPRGSGGAE